MGKPLSPFDLIRNDVFHRAHKTGEDDQKLFDERWKLFEHLSGQSRFGKAASSGRGPTIWCPHAVVAETAREANIGKIATEYQRYARDRSFQTVGEELDVLLTHAATCGDMELLTSTALTLRIAGVLRIWDLSTFLSYWHSEISPYSLSL
jgi:hypothetical protein